MNRLRKKPLLKKTVAISVLFFGMAGVVLPILPGWVLIGLGFYILSVDSPRIQEKILTYRTKYRFLDQALKISYDKLHAKHSITPEVV